MDSMPEWFKRGVRKKQELGLTNGPNIPEAETEASFLERYPLDQYIHEVLNEGTYFLVKVIRIADGVLEDESHKYIINGEPYYFVPDTYTNDFKIRKGDLRL